MSRRKQAKPRSVKGKKVFTGYFMSTGTVEETVTETPSVGSFGPRVVLRHRLGLDFGFLIACSCWLRHRSSEFNRNLSLTDASHQLNVLRWF